MKTLQTLKTEISSLCVFRSVLSDSVLQALLYYIDVLDKQGEAVSAYAEFVSRLYETNSGSLSRHIQALCNDSENVYVKLLGRGQKPPACMEKSVWNDLNILQQICDLTAERLKEPLQSDSFLPDYDCEQIDLVAEYRHRTENIGRYGYGKYARNRMFYVEDSGSITAVRYPDPITLDQLIDYETERRRIIDNTKALLEGKPAANILLTGDAGTGKSSTVKAVGNAFYDEGLRIIEVRKNQLRLIPEILDELALNPLKFILFIDDLSFVSGDDSFNSLKAILEGSVSARSHNVVVYATSNRRHMIQERFSDREGDEIHRNDTMQEMISLSNRFGIHITFQKPDKKTYLDIVRSLADQNNIPLSDEKLALEAERFALERGGRSARLAKQYIDSLLAQQQ